MCIDDIEKEIIDLDGFSRYELILCGDFNARTSNLCDFTNFDEILCEQNGINYDARNELDGEVNLECFGIQKIRVTEDKHKCNNLGRKLLSFCKNNNVFICNGRTGKDKYIGANTNVKGNTVIDYFICSPSVMCNIHDFYVDNFEPVISDIHCVVNCILKCKYFDDKIEKT